MISHIEGDPTEVAPLEQHPNFSHCLRSWLNTEGGKASKRKRPWTSLPTPKIPLCSLRKGALLFLQSNGQAGIPHIPGAEKSGVKFLRRGGRSVIQIAAVLSLQCTHVCGILKVFIVDVPLLFTVSAMKAHIPAAASSEVQGKLSGRAAGCVAPLCLFCQVKIWAGLLFSTCLTAFDERACFPVRPQAPV